MTTESFSTTSGKEVTVNISDAGEPESVVFEGVTISENELMEISEWIEDYDDDDDDDNENDVASASDAAGDGLAKEDANEL